MSISHSMLWMAIKNYQTESIEMECARIRNTLKTYWSKYKALVTFTFVMILRGTRLYWEHFFTLLECSSICILLFGWNLTLRRSCDLLRIVDNREAGLTSPWHHYDSQPICSFLSTVGLVHLVFIFRFCFPLFKVFKSF